MSRCFPYPPPGYSLSSARNEALIESIKLQKEKERKKEKKEKKEKRKEKKEKKEKRNEKEKRKDEKNPNLDKSDILKHYISDKSDIPKHHMTQNGLTDTKVEFLHKKREVETEQLDQSSLTEEHACPSSLPVPSSSSESTEKSKKRKRNSSPRDDTPVHGKVILIRLPSMKETEFDAISNDQQPCLNSERSDLPDGSRDVNCLRDGTTKFLNGKRNITADNTEKICSTSLQIDTGKIGINYKPMLPKKTVLTPMQKLELQYTNLLEDCFPPPIQDGCVLPTDDLDWLLVGRNQETRAEKTPRFGSDSLSCSRSWGLWPRAHYLPEVDLYALPFTVPY